MKVLITGTAGFIGFHLANKLLLEGHKIVGLDNINDYYDIQLKYARLDSAGIRKEEIKEGKMVASSVYPGYGFIKSDLADQTKTMQIFESERFDMVVHLAAQAGVRYSLTHPHAYIYSNITGFLNILESCRHFHVKHLVYASSSSVYGLNENFPFSTQSHTDHPKSLYAASKKSNEMMAHVYSSLYDIPTTGLRFFTVYGPWGRPDMALFIFTRAILEGKPIDIYNNGEMERDFTYIDDIVEGIRVVMLHPSAPNSHWDAAHPDPSSSSVPYKLYNIGNNQSVKLNDFITAIEKALGKKALKNYLPLQAGDVIKTLADVSDLERNFGYRPGTSMEKGVNEFISWFRNYYKV